MLVIFNLVLMYAFVYVVHSFQFTTKYSSSSKTNKWSVRTNTLKMMETDDEIDEESSIFVKRIKSNYLTNKFKDCRNEECRSSCSLSEVELLLRSVLPPVSNKELKEEINVLLSTIPQQSIKDNSIDVNEFLNAVCSYVTMYYLVWNMGNSRF